MTCASSSCAEGNLLNEHHSILAKGASANPGELGALQFFCFLLGHNEEAVQGTIFHCQPKRNGSDLCLPKRQTKQCCAHTQTI